MMGGGVRCFCLRNWCMCLVLMQYDGRQIWCLCAFFLLKSVNWCLPQAICYVFWKLCTVYFLKHVFKRTSHILRIILKVTTSFFCVCEIRVMIRAFLRKKEKVRALKIPAWWISKIWTWVPYLRVSLKLMEAAMLFSLKLLCRRHVLWTRYHMRSSFWIRFHEGKAAAPWSPSSVNICLKRDLESSMRRLSTVVG
jgi:hypothetical protein